MLKYFTENLHCANCPASENGFEGLFFEVTREFKKGMKRDDILYSFQCRLIRRRLKKEPKAIIVEGE